MRTILHADLNGFYASVECLYRPELRNRPLVVGGDEERRHGIVLAKNEVAKAWGIKTGETLWQARRRCPDVVVVPANFPLYLRVAQLARKIYRRYTNQVESFGIDECWLDVSGSLQGRSGEALADQLRREVYRKLGVTVSVGVSWNKIFAKFGSDYQKPDATTVITPENMSTLLWPAPVENLLYVGPATAGKLHRRGIDCIGDLAQCDPRWLRSFLGKWGLVLHRFANGWDDEPVSAYDERPLVKSIGNSMTTHRDLENGTDVRIVITLLAESVATRLRKQGLSCRGIALSVRGKSLYRQSWQRQLDVPTASAGTLIDAGCQLFEEHYCRSEPLRQVGIRGFDLEPTVAAQLRLFEEDRGKERALQEAVDEVRRRFGNHALMRAILLKDRKLAQLDPERDHVIHPVAYFKGGIGR